MTKLFFTILSFLAIATVYSQEQKPKIDCSPDSPEYNMRYAKLKELYIRMQSSESTMRYRKLNNEFREKSNYDFEKGTRDIMRSALNNVNAVHEWVFDNIEKTEFKDCAEAEAAIKNKREAYNQIFIDDANAELVIYKGETIGLCPDLFTNLMKN